MRRNGWSFGVTCGALGEASIRKDYFIASSLSHANGFAAKASDSKSTSAESFARQRVREEHAAANESRSARSMADAGSIV